MSSPVGVEVSFRGRCEPCPIDVTFAPLDVDDVERSRRGGEADGCEPVSVVLAST